MYYEPPRIIHIVATFVHSSTDEMRVMSYQIIRIRLVSHTWRLVDTSVINILASWHLGILASSCHSSLWRLFLLFIIVIYLLTSYKATTGLKPRPTALLKHQPWSLHQLLSASWQPFYGSFQPSLWVDLFPVSAACPIQFLLHARDRYVPPVACLFFN